MSIRTAVLAVAVGLAATPAPAALTTNDPIAFFAGRTESIGTVKIAMKKPFRSRAIGKGEIKADGSLDLVQRVEDEGEQPRERHWRMRLPRPAIIPVR